MVIFIDTEFTDFHQPKLLSLGAVSLSEHEHYVEVDLASTAGQLRKRAASEFVHWEVLDQWGMVPGTACAPREMATRTSAWLLGLPLGPTEPIEVAFDFHIDFELFEGLLRHARLWEALEDRLVPVDVAALCGTIDGELAAEESFRLLGRRGLRRHHALADAWALRAAYMTARDLQLKGQG